MNDGRDSKTLRAGLRNAQQLSKSPATPFMGSTGAPSGATTFSESATPGLRETRNAQPSQRTKHHIAFVVNGLQKTPNRRRNTPRAPTIHQGDLVQQRCESVQAVDEAAPEATYLNNSILSRGCSSSPAISRANTGRTKVGSLISPPAQPWLLATPRSTAFQGSGQKPSSPRGSVKMCLKKGANDEGVVSRRRSSCCCS